MKLECTRKGVTDHYAHLSPAVADNYKYLSSIKQGTIQNRVRVREQSLITSWNGVRLTQSRTSLYLFASSINTLYHCFFAGPFVPRTADSRSPVSQTYV